LLGGEEVQGRGDRAGNENKEVYRRWADELVVEREQQEFEGFEKSAKEDV
jgi:hypothetical protein